ncbi:PaaI family thioesterase [Calidifontimicrobium sp. SYSU G02091]|uniref:PaaI family thioesterase n=1 Tax=Calidifontimicrobium sp. SYSU G02091 TaxID=2926421 RepID=UPI001F53D065|nr:PaaI family thioesterase [Calidifontimicrobium sp. SYSU G02091]MCI1191544.1 PaaI family thioesterase [Calidifontimicrobium sp. SYSU G02091]
MDAEHEQALLDLGRDILAAQPFSRLVGTELDVLRPGHCVLSLTIVEALMQQHGFVHGGVLAYLADNALTYAGSTAMRAPVLTAEFKINFLRPAVGRRLVARADAVHVGRQQAVCRCDVVMVDDAGGEKLCAIAQGTIARTGDAPPHVVAAAKD